MLEYEYWEFRLPRGTSRNAARQVMTDHAEYGRWEVARVLLYRDGSRRITLRRTIIRQRRLM